MSTLEDWIATVRTTLGIRQEVDSTLVLDLAREAAHGVTRPAAPITTYLYGLAVAQGADPRRTAERLTELARVWRESDTE